jgi:hypothetical protein
VAQRAGRAKAKAKKKADKKIENEELKIENE